mgnify:CR=1 FL=1
MAVTIDGVEYDEKDIQDNLPKVDDGEAPTEAADVGSPDE